MFIRTNHKAEHILGYKVKTRYGPTWQAWGQEGANFRRMTLVVEGKRKEVCGPEGDEEEVGHSQVSSSSSETGPPSLSPSPSLLRQEHSWDYVPEGTVPPEPYLLWGGHWACGLHITIAVC